MNVYINKITGGYRRGMILVAANSILEAHNTMLADKDGSYYHMFYDYDNWRLSTLLIANIDKPQIIEEESYIK